MNLQRITRLHVLIAGVVVAVAIAAIFVLVFIGRLNKKIANIKAAIAESQPYINQRGQFEEQLQRAREEEVAVAEKWDDIMENRMPELDLSDPVGGMVRMWYFPDEELELMERWFRSTGAEVTGLGYPTFGIETHDPTRRNLPPLRWTLSVAVKDLPELLEWLKKLPEAPRFMQLESVTIGGPRQPGQPLLATVPVTMWLWTGVEPTQVAAAPTGAGGATAGGAGRGPAMGRGPRGGRGGGGMRGGRGPRGGMGGGGMRGGRGPRGGF